MVGKLLSFVKPDENSADLTSRGAHPLALMKSTLWWHGLDWLKDREINFLIYNARQIETGGKVSLIDTLETQEDRS